MMKGDWEYRDLDVTDKTKYVIRVFDGNNWVVFNDLNEAKLFWTDVMIEQAYDRAMGVLKR